MNLILSYSVNNDTILYKDGHTFLGSGEDKHGKEIHVWLKKGFELKTKSNINDCKNSPIDQHEMQDSRRNTIPACKLCGKIS